MTPPFIVVALYKFVDLANFEDLIPQIRKIAQTHHIRGTLLLAREGINGTISGTREGVDFLLNYLRTDSRFDDLEHKESFATEQPFYRLKVRPKKEIVTLGVDANPTQVVGTYIEPHQWNELIADPDVVVLDTRNDYEVQAGTFEGALNPKTDTFRQFPGYVQQTLDPKKHRRVAMFCTGGIRCEKASSYMLTQGFEEVYHLKGGILKYLETIPPEESLWSGECFVFDNRVTVQHGLAQGSYDLCHGCRAPLSNADRASQDYQAGVACPHCHGKRSPESLMRATERQKQIDLAKKHHKTHLGGYSHS